MATGEKWPRWAQGFVTPQEAEEIQQAVAACEEQTCGEVVPMIVRRSSVVGHVPWVITLLLLVAVLVFEIPQTSFFSQGSSAWLGFLLSALCFLLSVPLSHWGRLQRLLTPKGDQTFQVEERALLEFYSSGIPATKGRTGVLIFISLMERKAVILADEAIAQKLHKETWSQICQDLVIAIKENRTSQGLITAIQRSGELLAHHFPHGPEENINELSNQLILKE